MLITLLSYNKILYTNPVLPSSPVQFPSKIYKKIYESMGMKAQYKSQSTSICIL